MKAPDIPHDEHIRLAPLRSPGTYGHAEGVRALAAFAERLKTASRDADFSCDWAVMISLGCSSMLLGKTLKVLYQDFITRLRSTIRKPNADTEFYSRMGLNDDHSNNRSASH